MNGRRTGNKPWKRIYGVDRKYTRRVDRARERRQFTPGKAWLVSSGAQAEAEAALREYRVPVG